MEPKAELKRFIEKLIANERFIFIRFSDGEMEILRGSRLALNNECVIWSKGQSTFRYPIYDHKDFHPDRDKSLMEALTATAKHQSPEYFKGIPSTHNGDLDATKFMIELNGGSETNLTFSDLWINSNYKCFLNECLPVLKARPVTLIANFRTKPEKISEKWSLIAVPDGAFQNHAQIVEDIIQEVKLLPIGAVVLSSASSISNLIGHHISSLNIGVTFIDIGTALHEQLGFTDSRRLYLSQLKPWRLSTFKEKLGYFVSKGSRIKW